MQEAIYQMSHARLGTEGQCTKLSLRECLAMQWPGVGAPATVATQDTYQRSSAPATPRCICEAVQNCQQLCTFIRQIYWRGRHDVRTIVAGLALLDGATA